MNIIDINRKYRISLSTIELESLLGMLVAYIGYCSHIHSADIAVYGQFLRTVRIGQRVQSKLFKIKTQDKRKTNITLDASEASTLVSVFDSLEEDSLSDFNRSVIYNINEAITKKL